MSDEHFDDDIRDALLADDPGAVPARLQARMARIPDEAGRPRAMSPWRQRLAAYAVPAAVIAAAVVLAVVFGGIAFRGRQTASTPPSSVPSAVPSASSTAGPTVSAPPSPSPSAAAATPSPTSGPIAIAPSQVTGVMDGTFAIRDGVGYVFRLADTVSWPVLLAVNLQTSSTTVLVQLKNGHAISSYALADAGIAWVESWYTEKPIQCGGSTGCGPHQGQPVSWALNFTTLDGKTARLDSGVVTRWSVGGEGSGPLPPEMAAQGGRVAYAIPRLGVAGAPDASTIIVRSLPSGAAVRQIETQGYVAQLGIAGQALMYRDGTGEPPGVGTVDVGDTTLCATPSDGRDPVQLGTHVEAATLGDGGVAGDLRVAWTTSQPNDGSIHVAAADGSNAVAVQPAPAPQSGAYWPVIVGDGVVWTVQEQYGAGAGAIVVEAWNPAWAAAQEVTALGSPDAVSATGDRLLVTGGGIPMLVGSPEGAIPASALFGTAP